MVAASFAKVAFKKDGAEVYSAEVAVAYCGQPETVENIIKMAFVDLWNDVLSGKASKTAMHFNSVALGKVEYDAEVVPGICHNRPDIKVEGKTLR